MGYRISQVNKRRLISLDMHDAQSLFLLTLCDGGKFFVTTQNSVDLSSLFQKSRSHFTRLFSSGAEKWIRPTCLSSPSVQSIDRYGKIHRELHHPITTALSEGACAYQAYNLHTDTTDDDTSRHFVSQADPMN